MQDGGGEGVGCLATEMDMCVAEGKRAGRCGIVFGALALASMVMCVARVKWLNMV